MMPQQQGMSQQYVGYGAMHAGDPRKVGRMAAGFTDFKQRFSCCGLMMLWGMPLLAYLITSLYAMFLDTFTSCFLTGIIVVPLAVLWSASWCFRPLAVWSFRPLDLIFAVMLGQLWGGYIHNSFIMPHEDITNLNTYPNVQPDLYQGQQLMDAGVIEFVEGSHLDLSKSLGFKNEDTYCIAPIVGPTQNASSRMATYDFWAVGKNCCSGHSPDYHCGEHNNPRAHKGLRLMRDDERSFFRLAVEEAKATYNIEATHPIFMYWMENPQNEVSQYEDTGMSRYFLGAVVFGIFQLVDVLFVCAFFTGMLPTWMTRCCSCASLWNPDERTPYSGLGPV